MFIGGTFNNVNGEGHRKVAKLTASGDLVSPPASPSSGYSPTTAPVTGARIGSTTTKCPASESKRRARIGPRPTERSNASTGSFSRNGHTSKTGNQIPNAMTPTPGSSTSTITSDPTALSNGPHQPRRSGTTSPKTTPRRSPSTQLAKPHSCSS